MRLSQTRCCQNVQKLDLAADGRDQFMFPEVYNWNVINSAIHDKKELNKLNNTYSVVTEYITQ